MPESIQNSIDDFLQYLQFQKRYSSHTILSYHTDLKAFSIYLADSYGDITLQEIKTAYIRSWLAGLKEKNLTSKTINRKISALKSYFKYQVRTEAISASPMTTISSPKNARRLPKYVEKTDLDVLLTHVEFPQTWEGATEKLVLIVLYHTGMRLSELINLKSTGIDISNSALKVLGKGSKERIIPLSSKLISEIQAYLQLRSATWPATHLQYLFLNKNGEKLQPRSVYSFTRRYLSLVTTVEKRSPHVLRHSFATHLSNNGADLNAIKELLGHSSLAATQVYTHNSIEKLKEAYQKAHPKA